MKLSQTREAILREFEEKWGWDVSQGIKDGVIEHLTQALNDYTESIVRMVEGKKRKDEDRYLGNDSRCGVCGLHIAAGECQCYGYNQAINNIKEELVK